VIVGAFYLLGAAGAGGAAGAAGAAAAGSKPKPPVNPTNTDLPSSLPTPPTSAAASGSTSPSSHITRINTDLPSSLPTPKGSPLSPNSSLYSHTPTPKGSPLSPTSPPSSAPDPLEQFDVFSIIEYLQFTNLALILLLNLALLAFLLVTFRANGRTTYDFILRSLYQLVRSMARENIYLRKQQYFAILFYLFAVLLLANLVGLIPYSFTVTSSFVVTFFIALMHFLGVNTIFSSQYGMKSFGMFLPSGAPTVIAPFLVFIEAVSYVARVFSLSIRLFANMMSGHALLKILIGFA